MVAFGGLRNPVCGSRTTLVKELSVNIFPSLWRSSEMNANRHSVVGRFSIRLDEIERFLFKILPT